MLLTQARYSEKNWKIVYQGKTHFLENNPTEENKSTWS